MFGPLELVIVLAIVLLLFGARRLPSLGRDLGSGMREFKEGIVHPTPEPETTTSASPALDPAAASRSQRSPGSEASSS